MSETATGLHVQQADDGTPDQPTIRIPEGDELIPKTSFKPIAYKEKLFATKHHDVEYFIRHPQAMAEDLMRIYIAAGVIPILWGDVGSAKTRTIEAIAQERDENNVPYQVLTVQPSTEDPTVIHGLMVHKYDPTQGKDLTIRSVPEIAERIFKYYVLYRGLTILFLDEATTCLPAQQNAMLGLLSHGKYGNMDISPYAARIMAANPPGTVSTVQDLSEAVMNRCAHIAWYTDTDLWLAKWKTGFGADTKKPDYATAWFVENMLDTDRSKAFRDIDGEWSPETLVPWESVKMTARSMDNFGKIYPIINEAFRDSPDEIRHHFIVEAGVSLIGEYWRDKIKLVNSLEKKRVIPRNIVRLVREANVQPDWGHDRLVRELGDSLHRSGGSRLLADQEKQLFEKFGEHVSEEGVFNPDAYLAMWALASTAPEPSIRELAMPHLMDLSKTGAQQVKKNNLTKQQCMPRFVPTSIRDSLRSVVHSRREAEQTH